MLPLQRGDVILLSTDGFWSPLQEKDIIKGVQKQNFNKAIENLASTAEETSYPRSDNISVIGFRWLTTQAKKKPTKKIQNPIRKTSKDIENFNRELDDMIDKLKKIVGK